MAAGLSSRRRMLAALSCQEPDYVPCCFSAFQILRQKCTDSRDFIDRQIEMGLDAAVNIATPPVRHDPRVITREWLEEESGAPYPLLHKEYATPAGPLRTAVHKTVDWPWGDRIPFMDDFLIPRSRRFLITPEDDLEALGYLLGPSTGEDVSRLSNQIREAKDLAAERDLITVAFYGMVGDVACWLTGISQIAFLAEDHPAFLHRLLAIIEAWNRRQTDLVLEEGTDLLIRRAWYENADVWSPSQYERFLLPGLRRDAERAHRAGAKFGYLMSCASIPLLDMMMDAGVDVLLGIDPAQDPRMNLTELKRKTAGRMCLWGGVCGYLTVECGTAEEIRGQVRQAISTLGPGGGFILSPVTNVREDNEQVWRNLSALIDAWRSLRHYPVS